MDTGSPQAFTLSLNGNDSALILNVPGYRIKKPIELAIIESDRYGRYMAYPRIPGMSQFMSGYGDTKEEAAYRLFKKLDGNRFAKGIYDKYSQSELELLLERYEPAT